MPEPPAKKPEPVVSPKVLKVSPKVPDKPKKKKIELSTEPMEIDADAKVCSHRLYYSC